MNTQKSLSLAGVHQLRAPVTWSVLPGKAQSMEPKRWETVQGNGEGKIYTKGTA